MITEMVTGRSVWRRELSGVLFTVMVFAHPDRGTLFELFATRCGRVASLGRFESRAQALRAALSTAGGDGDERF